MTPYIIIATMNTYQENGVHTVVFNHTLKTSMEDAKTWIDIVCNAHHFTNLELLGNYERLTYYRAKFDREGWGRGFVDFEVWQEKDINL